jgi:aminoglycoside/choline kinase family phosphotransferase
MSSPNLAPAAVDLRRQAARQWLATLPAALGVQIDSLRPASADASFRRYFRVDTAAGGSAIVMDTPPDKEDCRPFLHVADLLRAAGLHAPRVLAQDLAQGFLLLADLGPTTYLAALQADPAQAPHLFADARTALLRWQRASRPGVLPPYDQALMRREVDLFADWYLARHLQLALDAASRTQLDSVLSILLEQCLAQPSVYVHRDFMPRNLMVSTPNPGVLDFQDAVYGPITYDIVSLMRDAFISWTEEQVIDSAVRYWEAARAAHLPVDADFADFYRAFEWMGLQRHLKVLGIFARIQYRDGKPQYLADTPRFVVYARTVAGRYRELAPLARLFDRWEGTAVRAGFTF